jgi:O-antigen/teichoic acid export membrane protein
VDSGAEGVPARSRTVTPVLTLGVASMAAAVLTWGLQAVAGRVLGPESYAAFMVVWGFVFFSVGVLAGLQQEVARAVTAARSAPDDGARSSVLRLSLVFGVVGAGAIALSAPLWAGRLFGPEWPTIAAAVAATLALYAVYNGVNGALAGREQWTDYATAMVSEAMLRLLLVGAVLVLAGGLGAQAWALAGAGVTWAVLSVRRGFREATRARGTGTLTDLSARSAHALVATGCSAVMISGFPVLLKITADQPLPAEAGVVLAAIVATRAPLLLPLAAFQTFVLSRFVRDPGRVLVTLAKLSGVVALLTVTGAVAAYFVGPSLLVLLYGPRFTIEPALIAILVVAAGLLTVQTLSGSAVLARGRHVAYAFGWLAGTAAAILVLMAPLSVEQRSAAALLVGSLVGLVLNLATLLRRRP